MRNFARVAAGGLALAAVLALGAPARASMTQESVLQDDPQLLGARPVQLDQRLRFLKAIGVDRLRVSVFWSNIAPAATSQSRPRFPSPGPRFPEAYPTGAWEPYDNIVVLARRHNLDLLFTLTGPAPAWATPGSHHREGLFRPDAQAFQDFATAVGLRYSGFYPVRDRNGQTHRLPRVDAWSIWNEPNFPSWLLPIWVDNRPKRAQDMIAAAPHHYRTLVDAAWAGLKATGHDGDLILIGETAPRGGKTPSRLVSSMPPAEFVRELYCLQADFRPYTGRPAHLRGCPVSRGGRREFRRAHPGLFKASGYAHHAYSLDGRTWRKPPWRPALKDNVLIGNLERLTRTLDRAAFLWGSQREPMGIWITEYGYQTSPPDPVSGVAPARQGPLTSWGEYMAYRNPRVASIAQFLYVDDKPIPGLGEENERRWISWQSGFFTQDFRPKAFFLHYLRPIHTVQRGRAVRVFGGYRPGPTGGPILARIEYSVGDGRWQPLRNFLVRNPRGYLDARVRTTAQGFIRILWRDPQRGIPAPSDAVYVP